MSVAEQALVDVTTPTCEKGIGKVILAPDSKDLIAGVRVQPHSVWPDDRGYFLEVARIGLGLVSEFPKDTTQI
jgi:dTDP-4-dehydrorhamnose 3,5-epimerase